MSHAYSAAAISGFFVLFLNYIKKSTNKRLFLLGALLGLIVLIRPINALCVFALPILFGSWKEFTAFLKHLFAKPVRILYPIITFLAVVSIQFIIYKIQTNEFFLYSYVGESLNVLKPNLSNFLISYKKGLFVYAPILFISLLGIFYLFKASAFRAVWWLLFTFGLIWVLSSWHQWWYGGGFGSRVMIEYLLMWAIPLGFLLKHAKPPVRWSAVVICLLLVLLSQHQTQQYMMGMIHWENMTKEAYWSVFLRPI
jgi:hypothetical protein